MTARRQFGAAIVACVAGAGLVLLALRQGWARVDYTAPRPLPSGSIPVSGQDLLPAATALALAALACMAAVIATRGVARRVARVVMAGLGAWIAVLVSEPVHEATVLAAASGQAAAGGYAGSLPGGNSAISGGVPSGGGLPAIGQASRVVLASGPWRAAALIGAVAVIAAGLAAAWRGPRWAVMSARFDQPVPARPQGGPPAPAAGRPGRRSCSPRVPDRSRHGRRAPAPCRSRGSAALLRPGPRPVSSDAAPAAPVPAAGAGRPRAGTSGPGPSRTGTGAHGPTATRPRCGKRSTAASISPIPPTAARAGRGARPGRGVVAHAAR